MTAVTVILIRLATAVETTGIGRSVGRNNFGFRFFAAMGILGRVRLHRSLTRTLPYRVDPDLSTALRALDETLKRSGQSDLTNRDGLQIFAIAVPLAGRGVVLFDMTPNALKSSFWLPKSIAPSRRGRHDNPCAAGELHR